MVDGDVEPISIVISSDIDCEEDFLELLRLVKVASANIADN